MEPKIKFKGGGSFVNKQQKFSADGQTLYVAWRNTIVSYNTKTAKRLRTFKGLRDPIADFSLHYFKNTEVVTACSVSGKIISWRVDVGIRFIKLTIPVEEVETFHFVDHVADGKHCRFLLSWISNRQIRFGFFDTERNKLASLNLQLAKSKYKYAVSVCSGSQYSQPPFMAVTHGNQVYFMKFFQKKIHQHCIELPKYFTCVSCNPVDECIVTGDSIGQILVWYNLTSKNPSRAVYHWHTLPVRCLSFSMSGTNFYSGGSECVLVKWHMDNSHQRQFLPRLTSTIEHVTVSNENQYIAVATGDNGVQVLDSTMNIISVVQHLVLGTQFSGGIAFDYRTRSMVLNGITGHVQFYSPHDISLLYNLDVVGQNKLTQEQNSHIENTDVTRFAIDSIGLWLATVEERPDDKYSFELRLKFWAFNTVKQQFELNTSIELPHAKSITHILFQPTNGDELKCVTVGNDKKFKVWQVQDVDSIYRDGKAWNCTRVGFYRDLLCNALSFSSDGSLLGVGFGPVLTTWLPDTCELKCSLVHPKSRDSLTAVQFGVSNECHLVVAATQNQLSVWNLLSLCMIWTVPLQVSLLVPNSMDLHMAVFTTDKQLFIFSPGTSTPLFTQQLDEEVLAATFIPNTDKIDAHVNWCQRSQLFFITPKQELFCLGADGDENEVLDIFTDNFGTSLFRNMQPQMKSSNIKHTKPVHHLTDLSCKNQQLKKLLDSPIHTMMPMHLTCGQVLRSFILERKISDVR